MWIQSWKFTKKRPGWLELSGGWDENTSHSVAFDVGVFEPLADNAGYVFLCKATEITGLKKNGDWSPGGLVCVEVHRSTYKNRKSVNDVWVDVDAEPVKGEKLLCEYLDGPGKELTQIPFKGRFNVNGANAFAEIFDVMGIKTYLKEIEMLTKEAYELLKPDASAKSGSKGGYPPVLAGDHAASRLKFIQEFYKSALSLDKLPDLIETAAYCDDGEDSVLIKLNKLLIACLPESSK